ncbi:RNA polymerase sigma factor, partial [Herbiconiux daphne]
SINLGAARADFYSKVTRHSNRETRNFNIDFESHDKGVLDPMRLILRHEFIEDSLTVLSETEKQVFLGYYIRGKSIKDLTNGKSPGTIKTLLYRIREKLIAYHNPEIKE